MNWFDRLPLTLFIVFALTLGLAPFAPEPHIWEKLKMLAAGDLTRPIDIFDLLLHGTPWVLLLCPLLLAGALVTETIFAWPGIGKWVYDAILGRDYPIVQGGTLLIALVFVLANLFVDISYALLDPRIRYD